MCAVWDLPCLAKEAAKAVAGQAASAGVDLLATAIQQSVGWIAENTLAWWVRLPSTDPAGGGAPAVQQLQNSLSAITIAVAVGGLMVGGIRMALTRRADPLIGIGRGLAVLTATAALGVAVPSMLLRGGDAFSTWVLEQAAGSDDLGRRMSTLLQVVAPPGVTIVLGVLAIVVGFVQAILMMFRQGSVLILTGCLMLAASGQFMEATRPWFRRVTGWMLALIFYKPAAAMVYAAAFTLAGDGQDQTSELAGFAMIVLSIVALPSLVKLFTWATGAAAGQASGAMGAALYAGAYGLTAAGSLGSGGQDNSAADQARLIEQQQNPQPTPSAATPAEQPPAPGGPDGGQQTGPGSKTGADATTAAGEGTAATEAAAAGGSGAAAGAGAAGAAGAEAAAGPVGVAVAVAREAVRTARAVGEQVAGSAVEGDPQ